MKLTMTTTLGVGDAARLGLPDAREASAVDASPDASEELLRRGWAVPFVEPVPTAVSGEPSLKAVPPKGPKQGSINA